MFMVGCLGLVLFLVFDFDVFVVLVWVCVYCQFCGRWLLVWLLWASWFCPLVGCRLLGLGLLLSRFGFMCLL